MSAEKARKKSNNRIVFLIGFFIYLVLIPIIIYLGIRIFSDRKYYFISLLIIFASMVPFAVRFENRKKSTRELVMMGVLVSIAAAGRMAFYMLPQFKPVAAIVILSGLCLGAETGFLIGALSAFVSNFFFGQGPWTPWQMLCFGLIGLLAGMSGQLGWLKKNKLSLCIFGALTTFFVYGGIINIGSMLMFSNQISVDALIIKYVSAFWFDVVHAFATVVFLYFISEPLIEKIERVRTKYGVFDRQVDSPALNVD